MNSHNTNPMETHFNKATMIFVFIVVILVIIGGVYSCNDERDNVAQTTETTLEETTSDRSTDTTTVIEDTTVPEDTTSEETTTLPPETTEIETTAPEPPAPEPYLVLTETERLIFATLIRLECGGSSYETKMAVASVVVNRMNMWDLTLRQAVFEKNVFSPARLIDRETGYSKYNPSKTGAYAQCWQVVDEICANGPTLPYYVIYFRSGHYHSWATPYAKIGSLYFSYSKKYM